MQTSRFSLAVADGLVDPPPEGRIAVFRPRAGVDLSGLPAERVQVVQGFWPDHQYFAAGGYDTVTAPEGRFVLAVVFLPRSKAEAHGLIARALDVTGGGPVVIDGQKTDGVESVLKDLRRAGAEVGTTFAKAHGKLFVMRGTAPEGWDVAAHEKTLPDGFVTVPGVFSADRVDPASALLASKLPARLAGRVADLGAGWGYLAASVLGHPGVTECHLIEAEHAALDCARRNVTDARARFHWADVASFVPDEPFDVIVTNPPFHTRRAADPSLGQAFIASAARMLTPGGSVWLVANRHLPYEAALKDAFKEVSEAFGDASFKVFHAAKPRKTGR